MGWHRNHAISHSPNQNFFEDTFVSHSGGPNEQFGTHEKLSWGGVQGNLNWMPGYMGQANQIVLAYLICFLTVFRANICRGGDTLIFSYIRIHRLGSFFGVQNFEFQYFLGFSEK